MFPERGAKARVLRESLQSVAVIFIYMPGGREGERAELVIFIALPPFKFFRNGGWGMDFPVDLFSRRWRFCYAWHRVGRASVLFLSI